MRNDDIGSEPADTTAIEHERMPSDVPAKEEPTPLPKSQITVIAIMLFTEPLSSSILFPFIYQMLRDFNLTDDEKQIGHYAGWTTSMFYIGQFLTAMQWGKLSDRIGRRPILLTGLLGNSITSILFGLSKSLWWAMASRLICGMLNGNSGVARSMVTEITDKTNRARAFTLFGLCVGSGMIGPALGGYLCKPAEQFPELFGDNQFLIRFPYFLPCATSAAISLVGFTIGFFNLKESNPRIITQSKQVNEQTPLLSDAQTSYNQQDGQGSQSANKDTERASSLSSTAETVTWASYGSILCYIIFAFHAIVFDEVQPLFSTSPVYAGGLGLTPKEFAKFLSTAGLVMVACQYFAYPKLNSIFPTLTLIRIALTLLVPVYILFPELLSVRAWAEARTGDPSGGNILRACYFGLILVRYFSNSVGYTSFFVIVNNSANPGVIGKVNGISQSALSFVRSIAPTLGGSFWAFSLHCTLGYPFDNHLVYYTIALVCTCGILVSFTVPNSVSLGGR